MVVYNNHYIVNVYKYIRYAEYMIINIRIKADTSHEIMQCLSYVMAL